MGSDFSASMYESFSPSNFKAILESFELQNNIFIIIIGEDQGVTKTIQSMDII